MHGEEESLSSQRLSKHHSWRIAEISCVLGSESLKIYQTAPTSPHVVREGFRKNSPHSSKNKLQQIQLSDTTGTSNDTGFYGLGLPLTTIFISINLSTNLSIN